MRALAILLLFLISGPVHAQKLQPTTGVMLTAPTDGAGNPCTAAAPCSNTGLPQTTTAVVAATTTITTGGSSQTAFSAGTLVRGGYIPMADQLRADRILASIVTTTGTPTSTPLSTNARNDFRLLGKLMHKTLDKALLTTLGRS